MKKHFLIFSAIILFAGVIIVLSRGFYFGEFPKKVAYFADIQLAFNDC